MPVCPSRASTASTKAMYQVICLGEESFIGCLHRLQIHFLNSIGAARFSGLTMRVHPEISCFREQVDMAFQESARSIVITPKSGGRCEFSNQSMIRRGRAAILEGRPAICQIIPFLVMVLREQIPCLALLGRPYEEKSRMDGPRPEGRPAICQFIPFQGIILRRQMPCLALLGRPYEKNPRMEVPHPWGCARRGEDL
jgi:hypothetical protein